MVEQTKAILSQAMIPVLAAAVGSWFGANTAIARMDERIKALETIVTTMEQRMAHTNDPMQGPIAEHREFRERISRLEARQEQVMFTLRMREK